MEAEAYDKMEEILFEYGLQISLKTLADSLQKMIDIRGPSVEGLMILEGLKGLHAGYIRRHEEEEFNERILQKQKGGS